MKKPVVFLAKFSVVVLSATTLQARSLVCSVEAFKSGSTITVKKACGNKPFQKNEIQVLEDPKTLIASTDKLMEILKVGEELIAQGYTLSHVLDDSPSVIMFYTDKNLKEHHSKSPVHSAVCAVKALRSGSTITITTACGKERFHQNKIHVSQESEESTDKLSEALKVGEELIAQGYTLSHVLTENPAVVMVYTHTH